MNIQSLRGREFLVSERLQASFFLLKKDPTPWSYFITVN